MRFTLLSGVRNDLIQLISDQTAASELHLHQIEVINTAILAYLNTERRFDNPLPVGFVHTTQLGPHASAIFNSYTVPINRRAVVSGASLSMQMSTAGAAPVDATTSITMVPSGGGLTQIATYVIREPTISIPYTKTIPMNYVLSAGDTIRLSTNATGVGANFQWGSSLAIMEYDA